MNQKAAELGLKNTAYADPSGLDPDNVSSAYDMARLITYAAGDERIAGLMRTEHCTVRTSRRIIQIHNTNQLLRTGSVDVVGGKTGFIAKAGYCLATLLRCRRSIRRWRWWCSAPGRTPRASWRLATCWTGFRREFR